jgi:simple sugar transport system ATP-binding protein
MGLRPVAGGKISVNGRDITQRPIIERRAAGVSYIAEDRIRTASAGLASATDNLTMGFHRQPPIAVRGLMRPKQARARARSLISKFDIKIASESTPVRTLSGGNLQKIVIARELAHDAPVLLAEQPTRGVDVGAIEFIHAQLIRERDRGHALLLVSAELSEILALSDRIVVIYEGRLIATFGRGEANETTLGLYMAGGARQPS